MNKDSRCRLLHIMHVVRHILPPHIARCQKTEIISFNCFLRLYFCHRLLHVHIMHVVRYTSCPTLLCVKKLRLFPLNAFYVFISANVIAYYACRQTDPSVLRCRVFQNCWQFHCRLSCFCFQYQPKKILNIIDQQSVVRQGIERRQGIESSLKLLFFQGAVRCQSAKN